MRRLRSMAWWRIRRSLWTPRWVSTCDLSCRRGGASVRRLRNGVQKYEWGSPVAIPQFMGHTPAGDPIAEMWIGTHPLNPSVAVASDGAEAPLIDEVGELPFMLKVLAAERP